MRAQNGLFLVENDAFVENCNLGVDLDTMSGLSISLSEQEGTKMARIYTIGSVELQTSESKMIQKVRPHVSVQVKADYRKGLKHIEEFSHVHLVCLTKNRELTVFSGKCDFEEVREGRLVLHELPEFLRVKEEEFPLELIDIKPYIPSEDDALTDCQEGNNQRILGTACQEGETELPYAGEIRNTKGVTYLQYSDAGKMPQTLSEYIHVVWWFDKFDKREYRRTLVCNPPYDTDGQLGVFASRAPVRPNPVALTVARVNQIDQINCRIYLSGIESFDHTPFLGIMDYDVRMDRFEKTEVTTPAYTKDWPDHLDSGDADAELAKSVEAAIISLDAAAELPKKDLTVSEEEKEIKTENNRPTHIVVKGARENNLKGISVSIPYGKITAVVGVSGSGKSSLVIDTVYAECHRRMESLNSKAAHYERPEMDSMTGCIPTVMISQKEIRGNANSTIGTYSGIHHHLRSIYAAIGKSHYRNPNQVNFKLTPATFSFLDAECRCRYCNGSGMRHTPDLSKIITHPKKSLLDGATPFLGKLRTYLENPNANWMKGQVVALAREEGVDLNTPWEELDEGFRQTVLYGDETRTVTFNYDNKKTGRKGDITRVVEGIIPAINRLYMEDDKGTMAERYMTRQVCDVCHGERLGAQGRLVCVAGVRFPVAAGMTFTQMQAFAWELKQKLPAEELMLVREHLEAILSLCRTAKRLGIDYLELSRVTAALSGGESGRLKLLSAFMNHMSGILYIFDEPSKKLSFHEYRYMMDMMKELITEGNTVLMVEHNMDLIKIADHVIEIGPDAGAKGGYLCAEGSYETVASLKNTLLAKYADSAETYDRVGRTRRTLQDAGKEIATVKHVCANNLKDVSVSFPKQALTCLTGVSGSGKSSLLYHGILPQMEKSKTFEQVVLVESKVTGGSSRSVVATYTRIMDEIRTLFGKTEEAREKGLTECDFSFNQGSLRCECCKGDGRVKIPFTEDSYGVCPMCHGSRYQKTVKELRYQGLSIDEVLDLSVEDANTFFKDSAPAIAQRCKVLIKVGLSYLKLGANTQMLSGGEAARLKIAGCLMDARMKNTLFLFDEPTVGLHFSDIDNLISLLFELIDAGNTVVAIEHNKRFLSAADYTITLGPGAGALGGMVVNR